MPHEMTFDFKVFISIIHVNLTNFLSFSCKCFGSPEKDYFNVKIWRLPALSLKRYDDAYVN